MANALTLVQTSPASNPDTNLVKSVVSGAYVSGTADPLPLTSIADPDSLVQVPLNNPGAAPPPVTPEVFGYTPGYFAQVQRIVTNGVTSFGLRWFQLSTGAELATGNFPAAITGGEIFLRILCPTVQQ
jgi:hypothetical protein